MDDPEMYADEGHTMAWACFQHTRLEFAPGARYQYSSMGILLAVKHVQANLLYATLGDLVAAFPKGSRRLTGNRERMGFMFDHDDVVQKHPQKQYKTAA